VDDGATPEVAGPELTPERLECALVLPALTEEEVLRGVAAARAYGIASVVVRPSDTDAAMRALEGSTVLLGAVCGFPHGSQTTGVKVYEARDLLRRGVREVNAVLNIGKLNSRQFHYIETELIQLAQTCHEGGGVLKVLFETPLLTEEGRLVGAKICKRSEVDWALAALRPVPLADETLMLKKCRPFVRVAAFATTLDGALDALARGCERISAPDPAAMLEAWKARRAAENAVSDAMLR